METIKHPVIPYIEGDGIGPEVMTAARAVLDAATARAFGGAKIIKWMEIAAGEKAQQIYGDALPGETLQTIRQYKVAIKGPTATPVGGGRRSINVALRRALDLFACIRPVRYFPGVAAPVKHPERLNVVIFRENTEDVYAGIEWQQGSDEALRVLRFLNENFKSGIKEDAGIGVKPITRSASKRLIRKAIQYALDNRRRSVALVHKGNIMKYTEGAFCQWGYEVAREEFPESVIAEKEARALGGAPSNKIIIKDVIADNMFQQLILRPEDCDIIATTNLNGDYLSDACAAQVGGLGLAPGANIGDDAAVFEATHGTAPDIAGKGKANPCSLILSGAMMLEHIGWRAAAERIHRAVSETLAQRQATPDLADQMEGATPLSTTDFAAAVIKNL
ncbi:MAG TPA: NADP-dependent isocitrate dehydrogenase [Candidatus Sumerlaeota bacterium]|nr:NADP-dependent isocitrate dehydrogenase [Candidatus Sumerlaeota bacterium]